MPDVGGAVQRLADACRETMAEGDRLLARDPVEHKILQALVADTAGDAKSWVYSRVPNAEKVAVPLENLAGALDKGNTFGKGLAAAQKGLAKQARKLALAAVGLATWPAWIASVASILAGLFLFSENTGAVLGNVTATTLLGGGAAAYFIFRLLHASAQVAKTAVPTSGLGNSIDAMGLRAEKIMEEHAGPAVIDLKRFGYPGGISRRVAVSLRGGARALVAFVYIILGACVLFFAAGVISGASDAYDHWQACHTSVTVPSNTKC